MAVCHSQDGIERTIGVLVGARRLLGHVDGGLGRRVTREHDHAGDRAAAQGSCRRCLATTAATRTAVTAATAGEKNQN
jgi:hypothetical protein